jgi:cytochrome b561
MIEDPNARVYSVPQRMLHWLTALLILITVPVAFAMDGKFGKVSDAVAGFLYDSHKLIGVIIFFVVVVRLVFRRTRGAPPQEPTVPPLQARAAELTHWAIYALLIMIPLGGYIALQLYGEIRLFGWLPLPSFLAPNKPLSEQIFAIHKLAGFVLIALVVLHFSAAMFHRFILKDNVLGRMWPSQKNPDA